MRRTITVTTAAVLTLLLASPVGAQEVVCSDVEFDADIIAKYPEVQDACLAVVEDGGVRYVHLRAEVQNNWISSMTIRYEHADGTWGPLKTVTPPEGFTAIVNGESRSVDEIEEGTVMNVFVPEGRWEVAMSDVAETPMAEMTFAAVASEEADEPVAEEPAEAAPAEVQAADAEEPAGGISLIGWILMGGALAIILWLLFARKKSTQEG